VHPRSLLGLALALSLSAGCGGGDRRPNVLLIVVDTLRADHLSCYGYGYETSPSIDRLAATGWRYENAISQAPWTTPSLGSLFTSRYPSQLGIEDERSVVSDELLLLPEVLQAHGYATGAVVSHSFCSSEWGFAQGFDSFDEDNVLGHRGITSPGVTEAGLDFLERHREEPFFLWLHYFDPHNQYLPHEGYGPPPPADYRGRIDPGTPFQRLKTLDLRKRELKEVRRFYDSEIAFTDHHVGRVLTRLEELGLDDSTIVVFAADHGEEFFDHGRLGHAHSLYQELVRVPLILRVPGEEPRVVADTVGLIDLYPTLLELLGLPAPEGLEGRSLLAPGERTVFTETSRFAHLQGVVRGRRKLVRDLEAGHTVVFDLQGDAGEQAHVVAEPDDELALALTAWVERIESTPPVRKEIELDPELLRELGELGYVDEEP